MKVKTKERTIDNKTKKILKSLKGKKVGIFVDDANLYHAYRNYSWRVDWKKFKKFISKYCDLQFIKYFIAIPKKNDPSYKGTCRFLKYIKPNVTVETKLLKYIKTGAKVVKKGDVDVEITLSVVENLKDLDCVLLISGDSDFLKLKEYVINKGKEIIFSGYEDNMAWEMRQIKHIYLNRIKSFIS